MCAKSLQLCPTLCDPMPVSSIHEILQARSGVGCHALLQGIFLTQGSNPCLFCLLHGLAGSFPLVSPGKQILPLILEKLLYQLSFSHLLAFSFSYWVINILLGEELL